MDRRSFLRFLPGAGLAAIVAGNLSGKADASPKRVEWIGVGNAVYFVDASAHVYSWNTDELIDLTR